jgi:hypothetical protein
MTDTNFNTSKETKTLKKFDLDLQYGQMREQKVHDMFFNKKFEIKSERDWWQKTGNIAIEVECYDKPSGISVTEADFWMHILTDGDKEYCKLIFKVSTIKKLAHKYRNKSVYGGDHRKSKFVLVPLKQLFTLDNIRLEENPHED